MEFGQCWSVRNSVLDVYCLSCIIHEKTSCVQNRDEL